MSATPIAAARRRTELGLVVMAATITGVAYTLASLGQNAEIPPILVPFLIAVLGLLVVAHLANRVLAKGADGTILPLAALLHGIGYVIIARLSERAAGLQTTWTFVAIVAYVVTLRGRPTRQRSGPLPVELPVPSARRCCCCRSCPASATPTAARGSGSASGRSTSSPVSSPRSLLALFFAGYLADHRELIAAGRLARRAVPPARARATCCRSRSPGASPSS